MAQVFRIYGFKILSIKTGLANPIMVAINMLFVSFGRRYSVSVLWEEVLLNHMRKNSYKLHISRVPN